MKRKILSLILIATTVLSLTACGEKEIANENNKQSTNESVNLETELQEEANDVMDGDFISTESLEQEQIEAGKSLIENSTTVFEKLPDGVVVEKEYILGNFAEEGSIQYNSFDMFSSNTIEYGYLITNNSGKDVAYNLEVEAVDATDYDIEDEKEYGYVIPNGESAFFSGSICLDADEVAEVDHLVVKIEETTSKDVGINREISFVHEISPNEEYDLFTDLKITTTNNSDKTASAIWVHYLLFDENGTLIDMGYSGWSDFLEKEPVPELQAGASGTVSTRYAQGDEIYFDDYEIYIEAYRTTE